MFSIIVCSMSQLYFAALNVYVFIKGVVDVQLGWTFLTHLDRDIISAH